MSIGGWTGVVRRLLPEVPLSRLYQALRAGEIRVNGARVAPDMRTRTGDLIWVCAPLAAGMTPEPARPPAAEAEAEPPPPILFRGRGVIVVDKPAGLPVHGSGDSVMARLRPAIAVPAAGAALSFGPGPVHQLDRVTSGALVIAETLTAARQWSAAFHGGHTLKLYLTVVEGAVPQRSVGSAAGARPVDGFAPGAPPADGAPAGGRPADALPATDGSADALPATDGSADALPAGDGSASALPAGDGSASALPANDGSASALPANDGSADALPAGHGSASALPAGDGSASALPANDGSASALPANDGSADALPASDGSASALPASDGSASALPASDGSASALPASDGSASALPASDGSADALPANDGSADALPPADGAPAVADGSAGGPAAGMLWADTLAYDRRRARAVRVRAGGGDGVSGKPARAQVWPLATCAGERSANGPLTLLLVRLDTGRRHQIRVQAALRGHPLLGDRRYGGRLPARPPAERPAPVGGGRRPLPLLHAAAIRNDRLALAAPVLAPLPAAARRFIDRRFGTGTARRAEAAVHTLIEATPAYPEAKLAHSETTLAHGDTAHAHGSATLARAAARPTPGETVRTHAAEPPQER